MELAAGGVGPAAVGLSSCMAVLALCLLSGAREEQHGSDICLGLGRDGVLGGFCGGCLSLVPYASGEEPSLQ